MNTAPIQVRRPASPASSRGFSLVELMIVVAIIGVLAALAVQGVRRFLATAKSAEARNMLGAISRSAVAAFEREVNASELQSGGGVSGTADHRLCDSAAPVPNAVASIANRKYTPNPAPNNDYDSGDALTGWRCLRFSSGEPQYYQYAYTKGGKTITTALSYAGGPSGWSSEAVGDLDGDGQMSNFMLVGAIANGEPITATAIAFDNAEE